MSKVGRKNSFLVNVIPLFIVDIIHRIHTIEIQIKFLQIDSIDLTINPINCKIGVE